MGKATLYSRLKISVKVRIHELIIHLILEEILLRKDGITRGRKRVATDVFKLLDEVCSS